MPDSFCFHDAFIRNNPAAPRVTNRRISEEEGVEHMVAHMCGVHHPEDDMDFHTFLEAVDPIGNSIRTVALKEGYSPLDGQGAESYNALLLSSLRGDTSAAKEIFDQVKSLRQPFLDPVQPVACIAASKAHVDLLKFTFEKGAQMDRDLMRAVRHGATSAKGKRKPYLKELNAQTTDLDKPYPGRRLGFDPRDRFDDINW